MNKVFFCVFLCFCFVFCHSAIAQQQITDKKEWKGFGIESNLRHGQMIRHTQKFTGPISNNCYGVELNFIKQTYGQKVWQERRNYPVVGFGFLYMNYNNPKVYGYAIGMYPNIQLNLVRTPKLEWTIKAGMGIGYVSKHYELNPSNNTENVAIGGKANNVSSFSSDLRYRFNEHLDFQAGMHFMHTSNAAFQQPNLGINVWGVQIGLRYFPITANPSLIKRDNLKPLKNRYLLQLRGSIAFKEGGWTDGPISPVYIGSALVSRRYWSKNKMFIGTDFHYHTLNYIFYRSIGGDDKKEAFRYSSQAAVFVGNEFLLGRIGVLFQLGYYYQRPIGKPDLMYQKIGGVFYFIQKEKGIFKEVYGTAILKTHLSNAELFEMGIGISL